MYVLMSTVVTMDVARAVCEDVCQESPEENPCEGITCVGGGVCAIAHDNTPVCICRPGYRYHLIDWRMAQCLEDEVPDPVKRLL